jgi:glutathione S-transferase
MKFYDGGRAPSPRRVRVFLAEKGIKIPTEQVDLGTLQHRTDAYAAINPMRRVPALALDDGHGHYGIGHDLPLLRGP